MGLTDLMVLAYDATRNWMALILLLGAFLSVFLVVLIIEQGKIR